MAAIRSKNTKPELAVRQALWAAGVRGWRCHLATVAGKPDLAFTRRKVAVFIDGAYWHGHPDFTRPDRSAYWENKITRTQARDRIANETLSADGWLVLRFWDFEVATDLVDVVERILASLANRP